MSVSASTALESSVGQLFGAVACTAPLPYSSNGAISEGAASAGIMSSSCGNNLSDEKVPVAAAGGGGGGGRRQMNSNQQPQSSGIGTPKELLSVPQCLLASISHTPRYVLYLSFLVFLQMVISDRAMASLQFTFNCAVASLQLD